jgi:ATP-binding cassette subfamily F protein 3
MAHIQASGISLAYGDRDLLSDVSITLASGDRCALAGANGSGKSTLMRILAGELHVDTGSIALSAGARVVYLPQSGVSHTGRSLLQEVEQAYGEIAELLEEQETVATEMQGMEPGDERLDTLLHRHHEIQERIELSGY